MRLALAGGEHASAPALAVAQPLNERRDRRARRDRQARQRLAGQHADVPATQALDGHAWFGTHAKNPDKHNTARRRRIDRPLVSIQLRDKIRRQSWALAVLRLVAHEAWHAGPAALAGSQMNVPRPVCAMFADPSHVVASGDMTSHEYEAFLGIFLVTTIPSGWTWRARWASNIAMANGGSRRWKSRGSADLPSRGCERHLGAAATSKGRCREPQYGRWRSQSKADRSMRRGRRSMRRDGGVKCSPIGACGGRRRNRSRKKTRTPASGSTIYPSSHCISLRVVRPARQAKGRRADRCLGRDRNVRSIGRHILKCKDRRSRREGEECPNLSPTSRP